MQPLPIGWIMLVVLGLVVLGYVFAASRKGKVGVTPIGSRREALFSPADPATVFARLAHIAPRYRIDDANAGSTQLVLSSPPTVFSWGFFYPVNIDAHGAGSRIEIGIQSKLFQYGPIVTNAHKRCVETVSQILATIPSVGAA